MKEQDRMPIQATAPPIERLLGYLDAPALTGTAQDAPLLPGLEEYTPRRPAAPSIIVCSKDLTQLPRLYRLLRELGFRYDTTRLPSGAHEIRLAPVTLS
jgi:hypothetical protein